MSLHNPYRTRKAQGLCTLNWNRRAYSKGPLNSYLNKDIEKENLNPRKFHKVSFLTPWPSPTEERDIAVFLVCLWVL